jgi:gluconolactonase
MANGNVFDRQGRLVTCEHASSHVVRHESDGGLKVLASHYDGKELNSPNDIVVKSDGAIYFTDPPYGRRLPDGLPRERQLAFCGVYRIATDESVTLLIDDFESPNGLCFSPDEKTLYINDTPRMHIRAFDVKADGTIANGRLFATLSGEGPGRPDGMKVDANGNVWCSGPGGIHVLTPAGEEIGAVDFPERVANFCWGDADRTSIYATATTSLYRVKTKVAGLRTY